MCVIDVAICLAIGVAIYVGMCVVVRDVLGIDIVTVTVIGCIIGVVIVLV